MCFAQRGRGLMGVGETAHVITPAAQQALHQEDQRLVVVHVHDVRLLAGGSGRGCGSLGRRGGQGGHRRVA